MKIINLDAQRAEQDFAVEAGQHFAAHPKHWTYGKSAADLQPGSLLALRWGLDGRSVAVLRISDDWPVIYADLVRPVVPPAGDFRLSCSTSGLHVDVAGVKLDLATKPVCQIDAMQKGDPYPRSCQRCGFAGQCELGLHRG